MWTWKAGKFALTRSSTAITWCWRTNASFRSTGSWCRRLRLPPRWTIGQAGREEPWQDVRQKFWAISSSDGRGGTRERSSLDRSPQRRRGRWESELQFLVGRDAVLNSIHQHFVQRTFFTVCFQIAHAPPATGHLEPDFLPCLFRKGEEYADDVRVELLARFANNLLARRFERLSLAIGAV